MKRIAVLTSGGDAPGMNAAIRSVVRVGIYHGLEVIGIRRGYEGLLEGDFVEMTRSSVSDILQRGGTILQTARSPEFQENGGPEKAARILQDRGIDSLIVIGGDGSFKGAKLLNDLGIPTIGVPGTIDNDLGYTDYTIGFYTAIETVMEAVGKLRDTSSSHGRMFVVEVMGRNCGDIALYAGVISGAENVIVPEVDYDMVEICRSVIQGQERGKNHHIILLSEGVTDANAFTKELSECSGYPARLAVIGHLQRGGSPTAFDRLLATQMGAKAVELLIHGKSGVAVGIRGNKLHCMEIDEAIGVRDRLNMNLYELAEILAK